MFTSDAKARWAADWVTWKGYDKFWTNLCRDLLPHAQAGEATVEFDSANGDLVVDYRLGRDVRRAGQDPGNFRVRPGWIRAADRGEEDRRGHVPRDGCRSARGRDCSACVR